MFLTFPNSQCYFEHYLLFGFCLDFMAEIHSPVTYYSCALTSITVWTLETMHISLDSEGLELLECI